MVPADSNFVFQIQNNFLLNENWYHESCHLYCYSSLINFCEIVMIDTLMDFFCILYKKPEFNFKFSTKQMETRN